jgi:hypothetical protein
MTGSVRFQPTRSCSQFVRLVTADWLEAGMVAAARARYPITVRAVTMRGAADMLAPKKGVD